MRRHLPLVLLAACVSCSAPPASTTQTGSSSTTTDLEKLTAEAIPVTRSGQVIAVIERSTNLNSARTPSRLELTYLQGADDLARMVAEGTFPYPGQDASMVRSPRVGDGLMRLDGAGRVTYASPNAQSAYRRLGFTADLLGAELGVHYLPADPSAPTGGVFSIG